MILRPYQAEAVAAVHSHICEKESNPCVVMPTGSGKSNTMAACIQQWKTQAPQTRGFVLAHRQELVIQNAMKLQTCFDAIGSLEKIGLFCAGLKQRDYYSSITFASVDSVYRRSGEFAPLDFIFVDEAHHIPPAGEGKYRTFIEGCRRFNPNLKVIGWTATPFRMGCGAICHKDHILNEICYEVGVTDLINQGYLCKLRSKVGSAEYDLSNVKKPLKSDYTKSSLLEITEAPAVVRAAVREAVSILNREERRSIIFFCLSIAHCDQVSRELGLHRIHAPVVTSKTDQKKRAEALRDLGNGRIRAVCNMGVLTEGFDAPIIDAIVLLRPTLSAGLFMQMVGRGLRPHEMKQDCLILDFAGCIEEHGPIDLISENNLYVAMATCGECRESFSRAIRKCPECGWEIPKCEAERIKADEKKKRDHGVEVSDRSILSEKRTTVDVIAVKVNRHKKDGKPDSLRIQFRHGQLFVVSYWCWLDHKGYPGKTARIWWEKYIQEVPPSVNDALGDLLLSQKILDSIKTITIQKKGKYNEIVDWNQELSV